LSHIERETHSEGNHCLHYPSFRCQKLILDNAKSIDEYEDEMRHYEKTSLSEESTVPKSNPVITSPASIALEHSREFHYFWIQSPSQIIIEGTFKSECCNINSSTVKHILRTKAKFDIYPLFTGVI